MRFKLWILALLTSGLAHPAAFGEDITGTWLFKAGADQRACDLSGTMTISAPSETGIRTCSFVSTSVCENLSIDKVQMQQSCRITPQAKSFIIRSKVITSITDGYDAEQYLADHFVVKPSVPKEMKGIWQDAQGAARVIFWRDDAQPVS